jgi:cytochrome bd-type quinol oxidase subunit 1
MIDPVAERTMQRWSYVENCDVIVATFIVVAFFLALIAGYIHKKNESSRLARFSWRAAIFFGDLVLAIAILYCVWRITYAWVGVYTP